MPKQTGRWLSLPLLLVALSIGWVSRSEAAETKAHAAAKADAEARCEKDAKCEGHECYDRAHCSSVDDAPFEAGKGTPTLVLRATRLSDGEGNINNESYFAWRGGKLVPLFEVNSDSGGDGPHSSTAAELVVCKTLTHGVNELDVRTRVSNVEAPTDAAGEWTTTGSESIKHYVWNGTSYDSSLPDDGCAPKLKAKEPSWLASASASSTLVEKGLPPGYYAAAAAADGLAETEWAEGAKGPGIGEWIEFKLARATAIKEVKLLPGCGTTKQRWALNERLKELRFVFSDGKTQNVSLPDSKFGELQTVSVSRTEATTSLRIVIVDVYKAKFEDACLSEVALVAR
jgi:hypothetical protein